MMYLWFLLAGAFAGTCAGLFGVGGGLIIVPVLMAIFKAYGYPSDVITHLAVGTSLATIVVTSISSMQSHNKRGGVRWDVWRNMSIGLVVGSFVGAYIADLLDGKVLAFLIAGMALFMGLKMLLAKKSEVVATTHLPSAPVQTEHIVRKMHTANSVDELPSIQAFKQPEKPNVLHNMVRKINR